MQSSELLSNQQMASLDRDARKGLQAELSKKLEDARGELEGLVNLFSRIGEGIRDLESESSQLASLRLSLHSQFQTLPEALISRLRVISAEILNLKSLSDKLSGMISESQFRIKLISDTLERARTFEVVSYEKLLLEEVSGLKSLSSLRR